MQHECRITKYRTRRHRTADGTLYYVAEGFEFWSHHPRQQEFERRIKDAIRPHMSGEVMFAPIFYKRPRWQRGSMVWQIYVRDLTDFMMLRLIDPVVVL